MAKNDPMFCSLSPVFREHRFEGGDGAWHCHYCGLRTPPCFKPIDRLVYNSVDAFVAEHFVVVSVRD